MAKDRTNAESPDDSGANEDAPAAADDARAARLAAIKAAVEAGDYDSDELLEIALKKMIQRLPDDDES